MIQQVKKNKFKKVLAIYLAMMILLESLQPMQMFALTSGPTQPEFNSFTPIGTSDMVDLASGDFNYNIPIMDVGGYPLNLSYNSGITMDQEASWVGLGWNLNVGQIERQVRGLPDDFKGDEVIYENKLRDNVTVGMNLAANIAVFGWDGISLGAGLGVESNNYEGISFKPSFGVGFQFNDNVSVGLNLSSSVAEGANVSPSVSLSAKSKDNDNYSLNSSLSLGLSSRKGVENLNLSASVKRTDKVLDKNGNQKKYDNGSGVTASESLGYGGSISFNNLTFTPSKRIGYENSNFTFNGSVGGEVFGLEGQAQITGYGSYQKIHPDYYTKKEKAFGYEFTDYKGNQSGVLDFNREKETIISERSTTLPLTVYTYDTYSIEGQGIGGMFRPFRSQVSNVYNDDVTDIGDSDTFGVEIGFGNTVHGGFSKVKTSSVSRTGRWNKNNNVLSLFNPNSADINEIDYEPVAYKMIGAMNVDPDEDYTSKFHGDHALRTDIGGGKKNGYTAKVFEGNSFSQPKPIVSAIKRTKRFVRTQVTQKVTKAEAKYDPFVTYRNGDSFVKDHHTAGIKILKADGSTYVYGLAAYNNQKIEATFDNSNPLNFTVGQNRTGLSRYNGDVKGNDIPTGDYASDQYVNRVTTGSYAHSYLITSVLSTDYEDIDNNGPSSNDLGSYTKFDYDEPIRDYKWRVPFEFKKVSHNNGLFSKKNDQKGNYLYGIKELTYLHKIVTKTQVAFFDLEERKDAIGVASESGGPGPGRMKKIKSIRLYSLPEVSLNGQIIDPGVNGAIKPIKTAHFEYDYSLCKKIPNSSTFNPLNPDNPDYNQGKLTLKKVYFTYRDSNMGKYTPYIFDYSSNNPNYDNKGFDIWGNYKVNPANATGEVNSTIPTTTEFPFVKQDAPTTDVNHPNKTIEAWNLKTIKLPSGGEIAIEVESDDYQYVQNKKAMQQFDVVGCGFNSTPTTTTDNPLYIGNRHINYLYVKVGENSLKMNNDEFKRKYLAENYEKAIQFRFLLNMRGDNNWQCEYVNGYFEIDRNKDIIVNNGIASIPVQMLYRDGGTNGHARVNPISKTGWGFGRSYLNTVVYGLTAKPNERDFKTIVDNLVGSIKAIGEIFKGPNKVLQDNGCAQRFVKGKSWIRLENPDGKKFGGGLRVKSIKLSDQWKSMISLSSSTGTNLTNMEYGQTYSYTDNEGLSSGVATFEPNGSSENPLVEPIYNNQDDIKYKEKIASPKENNYVEKPLGENFFPSPKVTYSKVSVRNLDWKDESSSQSIVTKHRTGQVVTEFHTSRFFPTKVESTNIDIIPDITPNNIIENMLKNGNINVKNHLTMSQGFSIVTNDMNGKIKSEKVFEEGAGEKNFISSVEYKYNTDDNGNVNPELVTINPDGSVKKKYLGLDYDMINDYYESYAKTDINGSDLNTSFFIVGIFPILAPTAFPKRSSNENLLRTAVTTKHIHKTAVLVEKIATDLGARVSTKNLAWDANSGEVLLTETQNEYGDNYYSFNYPAHWMYEGMGGAYQNIGMEGVLMPNIPFSPPTSSSTASSNPYFKVMGYNGNITRIFKLGDEISVPSGIVQSSNVLNINLPTEYKLWVVGFSPDNNSVLLMDKNGEYINKCEDLGRFYFKITRSGNRNLQTNSMATITSMVNPILTNLNGTLSLNLDSFNYGGGTGFNPRIINASAVEYNDFWLPQLENRLLNYPTANSSYLTATGLPKYPNNIKVNPYVWNIKGDWRAEKSYAHLTGRNAPVAVADVNNTRNQGFFTSFIPFYQQISGVWTKVYTGWTNASSITQISPFGVELENKDALNRYSSAQYGYQYKLPMAVTSNSKYSQMGYEGFEEIKEGNIYKHFGFLDQQKNIDIKNSHTGKASLKVNKGKSALLIKKLKPNIKKIYQVTCPTIKAPPSSPANCYYIKSGNFSNFSCDDQSNCSYPVGTTPVPFSKSWTIDFCNDILSVSTSLDNITRKDLKPIIHIYGRSIILCYFPYYGTSITYNNFEITVTLSDGREYCFLANRKSIARTSYCIDGYAYISQIVPITCTNDYE